MRALRSEVIPCPSTNIAVSSAMLTSAGSYAHRARRSGARNVLAAASAASPRFSPRPVQVRTVVQARPDRAAHLAGQQVVQGATSESAEADELLSHTANTAGNRLTPIALSGRWLNERDR